MVFVIPTAAWDPASAGFAARDSEPVMNVSFLPYDAPLADYEAQADDLLEAWRAGDAHAVQLVKQKHPRFRDEAIPWLPRPLSDAEVRAVAFDRGDAQATVARGYDFRDWGAVVEYAEAVADTSSPVVRFETAVEAVINGDGAALATLLRDHPNLARARSTRVTCFDPPVHRATLLHYVAANGVENHRQRTPPNAVEIANLLLGAGADPDALADLYGGQCSVMSMLVSSGPPAQAGVQVALIDALVDAGASVEAHGAGDWASPLITALTFECMPAAQALLRRGARADTIAAAAGLGRVEDVARLLTSSDAMGRHMALALAAQHGHAEIVRLLLDAGEDPDRFNPRGHHRYSTPLHQAVWGAHLDVVRELVERGARLDIRDAVHKSTPLGWAEYGKRDETAEYLRAHGAVL
jgi:hypothetical protein